MVYGCHADGCKGVVGEEDSHLGDFIEDKNAILPINAAIQSNLRKTTTRVLASLTPREERVLRMRFGIGMNTDHTLEEVGRQFLGDQRAHPSDRSEGAAEAEASVAVAEAAVVLGQLTPLLHPCIQKLPILRELAYALCAGS